MLTQFSCCLAIVMIDRVAFGIHALAKNAGDQNHPSIGSIKDHVPAVLYSL